MNPPPTRPRRLRGCAVLVPVKSFEAGKARLSPLLDRSERAELSRTMAEHVLAAARPLPVAVVCGDPAVAAWAEDHHAMVLREPGRGLNGAVQAGTHRLVAAGADEVLVVHADLPHARDLARLAGFAGVTLVPDRRDDGTNVIGVPASTPFRFSYGPGSFARHRAHALALGSTVRVLRSPELTWDVDVPDDIPIGLGQRGRR